MCVCLYTYIICLLKKNNIKQLYAPSTSYTPQTAIIILIKHNAQILIKLVPEPKYILSPPPVPNLGLQTLTSCFAISEGISSHQPLSSQTMRSDFASLDCNPQSRINLFNALAAKVLLFVCTYNSPK